jgi:hypothetical protein
VPNVAGLSVLPVSASEGQAFSGSVATFSSSDSGGVFSATIDWGDGTTTAGTVTGVFGLTVAGSHSYADEGSFTTRVTVQETGLAVTPPTSGTAVGTAAVAEADVLTPVNSPAQNGVVATFINTGYPHNTAADFTATIDWGDGTTTAGTVVAAGNGQLQVLGNHGYLDEGTFPVTVTLADDAPGTAVAVDSSLVASVGEGDALAVSVASFSTAAGSTVSGVVANFTSANLANGAGDFSATINWGDGTVTTGQVVGGNGTFAVTGSHSYTQTGNFTVIVQVADDDPGSAAASSAGTATITPTGPSQRLQQQQLLAAALQGTASTPQGLVGLQASFTGLFALASQQFGSLASQLVMDEFQLVTDVVLDTAVQAMGGHDPALDAAVGQLSFAIDTNPLFQTNLGFNLGVTASTLARHQIGV